MSENTSQKIDHDLVKQMIVEKYSSDRIHILPGVRGPSNPIMIDAPNWSRVQSTLEWISQESPELQSTPSFARFTPIFSSTDLKVEKDTTPSNSSENLLKESLSTDSEVFDLQGLEKTLTSVKKEDYASGYASFKKSINSDLSKTTNNSTSASMDLSNLKSFDQNHQTLSQASLELPKPSSAEQVNVSNQVLAAENIISVNQIKNLPVDNSISEDNNVYKLSLNLPILSKSEQLRLENEHDLDLQENLALDQQTEEVDLITETEQQTVQMKDSFELVQVQTADQGASGKQFLPVRNAYDFSQKESAGAPMLLMWQQPQTQSCQFAMVRVTDAVPVVQKSFRCTHISPHGRGKIALNYEEGKLGPTNAPAIHITSLKNKTTKAPVYFLEGARVNKNAHTLGRNSVVSGNALAYAIIAQSKSHAHDFSLPSGKTNVNLRALDSELFKTQTVLKGWNNTHEPKFKKDAKQNKLNQSEFLIEEALGRIAKARQELSGLQAKGVHTGEIDFSQYSSQPTLFAQQLSEDLGTANLQQAYGLDLQGERELGYGLNLGIHS